MLYTATCPLCTWTDSAAGGCGAAGRIITHRASEHVRTRHRDGMSKTRWAAINAKIRTSRRAKQGRK